MFLIFDISILEIFSKKRKKKIWKAFDYFQRSWIIFKKKKEKKDTRERDNFHRVWNKNSEDFRRLQFLPKSKTVSVS